MQDDQRHFQNWTCHKFSSLHVTSKPATHGKADIPVTPTCMELRSLTELRAWITYSPIINHSILFFSRVPWMIQRPQSLFFAGSWQENASPLHIVSEASVSFQGGKKWTLKIQIWASTGYQWNPQPNPKMQREFSNFLLLNSFYDMKLIFHEIISNDQRGLCIGNIKKKLDGVFNAIALYSSSPWL